MVEYFGLKDGSSILDVGCAKGFLLHDFKMLNPTFEIHGIDVSDFAISNGIPSVRDNLVCASSTDLPFDDKYFDLVICVNVLVNLHENDVRQTIREINRVSKECQFIQTPAYRTEKERTNLLNWVPVHNCVLHIDEWKTLFQEEGYSGHYYWFVFYDL